MVRSLPELPEMPAPNSALAGIAPIARDAGRLLESPAQIAELVEAPLVEPVTKLWEKHITTITSSANEEGTEAYIGLNFDFLSPANRAIAESLLQAEAPLPDDRGQVTFVPANDPQHGRTVHNSLFLSLPVEGQTRQSITDYFTAVADLFEPQPPAIESPATTETDTTT